MAICQQCGKETRNRTSRNYGNLRLCNNCRIAVDEAERQQKEWEAQCQSAAR
jgi:hypothetical protein